MHSVNDLDQKQLQTSFHFDQTSNTHGSIECLGRAFENDGARRNYFLDKLREKLLEPEFRQREGFPQASEAEILALSNPPYYTACPNPFLAEFIKNYGKSNGVEHEEYRNEPFAADVSEGKNDPIYNAQVYHTKVPPKAIVRYIEHYCPQDGVVFDGFCGSGMTGVAARLTGRQAILVDLAPAATAIAASYALPLDPHEAETEAAALIKFLDDTCGWLYQTAKGQTLDYMIWSEKYRCPNCAAEFAFAEIGFDFETKHPKDRLKCPKCDLSLDANALERCLDHAGKTIEVPVRVRDVDVVRPKERPADEADLQLLQKVEAQELPYSFPSHRMMNASINADGWGDMWRRGYHAGVSKVIDFYYKRTLWVLAAALHHLRELNVSAATRHFLRATIINSSINLTKMRRAYQGILPLVLYLPRLRRECNVIRYLESRFQTTRESLAEIPARGRVIISTQSSTALDLPDNSVDYIFTDPPFGNNIIYSEVNFLWEAWLGAITQQKSEAIISAAQRKGLPEYQALMQRCFAEFCRILKPGRWITVEFHNSRNNVWMAIQEALLHAGFVVADVRTLDKQQKSFKQITAGGTVKQDLIVSAYKPEARLEQRLQLETGVEESVWDFVQTHLCQLPVFVAQNGRAEIIAERQNYLLFDRMVAFHVQRGVTVPLSAAEFYAGLEQRFIQRDGMYFLPEQVAEYDKKRMTVKEVLQLEIFVADEASAIQWLKQQLTPKPQTFQELHPQFMKELGGWQKHEKPLELLELLQQNFLSHDGKGEVPSQIRDYLLANLEELRQDDSALQAKAKNRWYVPDPQIAGDLEKLRERALLKEFEEYRKPNQRRLKVFRLEAIRAGFKKAWQERDYQTIIAVANKIPENVLQEDAKLLMWYDQALTRTA